LLAAKNENKLKELIPLLKDRNIPHALITDCGYTVFTEPTVTCLGIGPCWPEEIDDLTKRFQTLKTYKFD
jgi:peptidyl-tRNA hydrolase